MPRKVARNQDDSQIHLLQRLHKAFGGEPDGRWLQATCNLAHQDLAGLLVATASFPSSQGAQGDGQQPCQADVVITAWKHTRTRQRKIPDEVTERAFPQRCTPRYWHNLSLAQRRGSLLPVGYADCEHMRLGHLRHTALETFVCPGRSDREHALLLLERKRAQALHPQRGEKSPHVDLSLCTADPASSTLPAGGPVLQCWFNVQEALQQTVLLLPGSLCPWKKRHLLDTVLCLRLAARFSPLTYPQPFPSWLPPGSAGRQYIRQTARQNSKQATSTILLDLYTRTAALHKPCSIVCQQPARLCHVPAYLVDYELVPLTTSLPIGKDTRGLTYSHAGPRHAHVRPLWPASPAHQARLLSTERGAGHSRVSSLTPGFPTADADVISRTFLYNSVGAATRAKGACVQNPTFFFARITVGRRPMEYSSLKVFAGRLKADAASPPGSSRPYMGTSGLSASSCHSLTDQIHPMISWPQQPVPGLLAHILFCGQPGGRNMPVHTRSRRPSLHTPKPQQRLIHVVLSLDSRVCSYPLLFNVSLLPADLSERSMII